MADHDEDIDALQAELMKAREDGGWFITVDQAKDFSRAITALVAERDEYKARCKAQHEVMADMVGKEREADRDLRERLIESALRGVACSSIMTDSASERLGRQAVWVVDGALAAMRKGATDAE